MRIAVDFQDERLEFEVDDERVIAHRSSPDRTASADAGHLTLGAIESPRDYPPLLQAVVPGDRVALPVDPSLPDLTEVLAAVVGVLRRAEVDSITVVSTIQAPPSLPDGVAWEVHDPDDRPGMAYLSATSDGQRVYLNRTLTDADIVIPIGTLGYDSTLGYRGPWSVIYPGLSDREALARFARQATDEPPDHERPRAALRESAEVSWLLGCQFQIGVVPGVAGVGSVIAGLESAVREAGPEAVDAAWSFRVADRADLVVAGVGAPGRPTSIEELVEGIANASRLVRRGGKIVALSRAGGEAGPALRRIARTEDPGAALGALRGHEADPDYPAARGLATALAWADVYLHSTLDPDLVDELGIVPIDRPGEARKLLAAAPSCILLSQADRTRARVEGEE